MARRRRKKFFGLFGKSRSRRGASIPQKCKTGLSHCMKGGGKRRAGPCMREFWACRRAA